MMEEPYLGPQLSTTRAAVAVDLWRYGEDELAVRMLTAPPASPSRRIVWAAAVRLVEHREGPEQTHRRLVAGTTALAADLVQAWLDDAPGGRDQPWQPGMPDVKAMAAGRA